MRRDNRRARHDGGAQGRSVDQQHVSAAAHPQHQPEQQQCQRDYHHNADGERGRLIRVAGVVKQQHRHRRHLRYRGYEKDHRRQRDHAAHEEEHAHADDRGRNDRQGDLPQRLDKTATQRRRRFVKHPADLINAGHGDQVALRVIVVNVA